RDWAYIKGGQVATLSAPTDLALFSKGVIAIVPASSRPSGGVPRFRNPPPALALWVRGILVALTVGVVAVFAIALRLNPYGTDGRPLRMETHRQLGLPPCTFYLMTGLPCPSCGMTTSFAFLVRGDLVNSVRA